MPSAGMARFGLALCTALTISALGAIDSAGQEHSFQLPSVIRVLLSGISDDLAIEPTGPAKASFNGREVQLRDSDRVVFGRTSWFLTLPAAALPPWASGMGLAGPAPQERPTQVHLGPYMSASASERHRRLVRAETGIAARLLPPRPAFVVGSWATYELPAELSVLPTNLDTPMLLNGIPYRGEIHVRRVGSDLSVVNHVELSDYLASVVGAEMPSSWELEALKTQAVAARTYAIQRVRPEASYDLCDNQNCQAYDGMRSESNRTRAAVTDTAGVVAFFGEVPIEALYSANAGDITEDSENVWGNAVPYLRSVGSPTDAAALSVAWGASGYRWTRVVGLHELAGYRALRNAGVGTVIRLEVLEWTDSGRPLRVLIVGTTGQLELFGDEVRTALGLPSAFVLFEIAPASSLTLVGPTPGRFDQIFDEGHRLVSIRRSVAFDVAPAGFSLVNGSVHIAVFERPEAVIFKGRGFGHGLGMSQWGAQGLALEGQTYDQILTHYYTGIDLRVLSGADSLTLSYPRT